jgi:hypothetical protein
LAKSVLISSPNPLPVDKVFNQYKKVRSKTTNTNKFQTEKDDQVWNSKTMTMCSEATESRIDFSEKPGQPLFRSADSLDMSQDQVQVPSSVDTLLWEADEYLEDIMQHLAYMEVATHKKKWF